MTLNKQRTTNTNDVAIVTSVQINSVTATTISVSNSDRISFTASLDENSVDVDVAIRYYPAAQDNDFMGDVLKRFTQGNNNLYKSNHKMCTDNIYTGEISAISNNGTHNIYITEY